MYEKRFEQKILTELVHNVRISFTSNRLAKQTWLLATVKIEQQIAEKLTISKNTIYDSMKNEESSLAG